MECLQEDVILKFNSDTLTAVRKEYNLSNPKTLNEAIDVLDDWTKKQTHFLKSDYPREYLERTIITTKGSVERAKARLDKLSTLKTLLPNYFCIYDIKELRDSSDIVVFGHLSKPTKDNYRVFMTKILSTDLDSSIILDHYRTLLILSEYIRIRDYVNGFVIVLDYRDINVINFITKVNPIELRNFMTLLIEGYGLRLKAIHILTASKMTDALIGFIKQVVSPKVQNRIHLHRIVDTLYDHIPREILPKDYGGEERTMAKIYSDWRSIIGSEEWVEYTKMIFKAGTNEDYRQAYQFNEQYSGMPGAFRSLTVD